MPISKPGTVHHSSFDSPPCPDHNAGAGGIDSFKGRTPVSSGRARTAPYGPRGPWSPWATAGRVARKLRDFRPSPARTTPVVSSEGSLTRGAPALGSISARLIPGTGKRPLPLALRFIPDVPQALQRAGVDTREHDASLRHDPGSLATAWWRRAYASLVYRLKSWTAPKGYRALQITREREKAMCEKVMSAAYVFLNAMRSGESLDKHFEDLKRRVRRLDHYAGVSCGISELSTHALSEAAYNEAARHDGAMSAIERIDRRDLLDKGADCADFDQEDFLRGDGILFAMEYPMAPGIALYGQALRYIAAVDPEDRAGCDIIRGAVDMVLRREAESGDAARIRQEWLGNAVRRLPNRTLQRLGVVLDAELACRFEDRCQNFLRDLAPVVDAHLRSYRGQ